MGGLVLVVGALMVAAGGYEMVVGNGDILSERGWSAFISGAVLVSGGFVTTALGLAVRTLEGLRDAILGQVVPVSAAPSRRAEPASEASPAVPPAPPEPARGPAFHEAPTVPMLAAPPLVAAAAHDDLAVPQDETEPRETDATPPAATTTSEAPHGDWLDDRFADMEREVARPEVATPLRAPEPATDSVVPAPSEPAYAAKFPAAAEPGPVYEPKPHETEPLAEPVLLETPRPEPTVPEPEPHETPDAEPALEEPADDRATVSAREETAPPPSPVIGRYESEGTSYVMYADGSIDAQSEAGIYRFASMAELKTFIES